MTQFNVSVANASGSAGVGATIIEAPTEEDAKAIYAAVEGMTIEGLAAAGLDTWKVEAL